MKKAIVALLLAVGVIAIPTAQSVKPRGRTYAQRVLADGPVGYWRLGERGFGRQVKSSASTSYWRLNESSGNVADSIGALTGTASGGLTYGLSGPMSDGDTAVAFGGSGKITFGDNYDFTGTSSFSVGVWFYITSVPATQYSRLVSKEDGAGATRQGWDILVRPQSDGSPGPGYVSFERFQDGSGSAVHTLAPVTLSQWNFVVVTYDGTSMKIYLNGVLQNSAASSLSIVDNAKNFTLGAHSVSGGGFVGELAKVFVSGRTLSDAEVSALFALHTSPDVTVSATAEDSSGNGYSAAYPGLALGSSGPIGDGNTAVAAGAGRANDWITASGVPAQVDTLSLEWWFKGLDSDTQFSSAGPRRDFGTDPNRSGFIVDKRGVSPNGSLGVRIDTSAEQNHTYYLSASGAPGTGVHVWDNQWHYLVLTLDRGTWEWFLDGALLGSGSYQHGTGFQNAGIAFSPAGLSNPDMFIDEVALYDYVLTPSQVKDHWLGQSVSGHLQVRNWGFRNAWAH